MKIIKYNKSTQTIIDLEYSNAVLHLEAMERSYKALLRFKDKEQRLILSVHSDLTERILDFDKSIDIHLFQLKCMKTVREEFEENRWGSEVRGIDEWK